MKYPEFQFWVFDLSQKSFRLFRFRVRLTNISVLMSGFHRDFVILCTCCRHSKCFASVLSFLVKCTSFLWVWCAWNTNSDIRRKPGWTQKHKLKSSRTSALFLAVSQILILKVCTKKTLCRKTLPDTQFPLKIREEFLCSLRTVLLGHLC